MSNPYASLFKKIKAIIELLKAIKEYFSKGLEDHYQKVAKLLMSLPGIQVKEIRLSRGVRVKCGNFTYKDQTLTIFYIYKTSIHIYLFPLLLYIDIALSQLEKYAYDLFKQSSKKRKLIKKFLEDITLHRSKLHGIFREAILNKLYIRVLAPERLKQYSSSDMDSSIAKKFSGSMQSFVAEKKLDDIISILSNIYNKQKNFEISILLS